MLKLRTALFILFSLIGIMYLIPFIFNSSEKKPYYSVIQTTEEANSPERTPALPQPTVPPSKVTLLFGGDLMFDRHIRLALEKNGVDFALKELQQLFLQHDFVIANLEGPVTSFSSKSVGSVVGSTNNYLFTFDPSIAEMLHKMNITIVNIGNNHILNFGVAGLSQTKVQLDESKVRYFGNASSDESERIVFVEKNGMRIAFTSYNEFGADGFQRALADIQKARATADIVVMYTHWGAEYQPQANSVIQNQAHQFIDAGADAIIGSHPHVVQQHELYKDKHIYYSLGNFVFDQYFEEAVQNGLLISLAIENKKILNVNEIPITLQKNGQTILKN